MADERQLAMAELERRGVDPFSGIGITNDPLVELLLQGITGTGATIAGGLAGIAGLPFGIDAAANAVRRTQEALTYQPRSRQAQEFGQAVGELMEPIEQGKQWLGDKTYEATGSPLAATIASVSPEIIEAALGLRAAKGLGGQQYEIGDIGGQATGVGRREMGAVGGMDAPQSKYFSEEIDSIESRVARDQIQQIQDEMDDGLTLREAIREVEPDEDEAWDYINKFNQPKIKNVPEDSYTYESYSADSDEWGGLEGAIEIDQFKISDDLKGEGLSRSALVDIVNRIKIDNPDAEIVLRANPIGDGLSQTELVQLYRSVGFEVIDELAEIDSVPMKFEGFPDYVTAPRPDG